MNGDGTITYTPNTGFVGVDSFTYTVSDGNGGTDSATVTITVSEPAAETFTPSDDLYAEQWHLAMLGDMERLWYEYTGAGVHVGIYDDGIEYDHVDLDGNYFDATVWGLPDPYPTTQDEAKHGTAVAGVIAAEANGLGTVGIAFEATISGVNIFSGPADINANNKTGFYAASDEQYRFDIVNHSWGSAPVYLNDTVSPTPEIIQDWEFALLNGRDGLGTIIVKAAGNEADNAEGDFLNAVRYSVTVAAYDSDGDASWYTNRGANVLVSAPSSGHTIYDANTGELLPESNLRIATTDRAGQWGYADGGDWSSSNDISGFGGTSSATPTVSGVVALMLEASPDLGWCDVQNILAYSAHHVGGPIGGTYTATETVPESWIVPGGDANTMVTVPVDYFDWSINGADDWNGGGLHFSEDYGFGGVDAWNAVRMAEVWTLFDVAQTSANEFTASTGTFDPGLSVSGNGSSASYDFVYSGPAMDLEYVDITVELGGEYLEEVELTLTAPSGTSVVLMSPDINTYTPISENFFYPIFGNPLAPLTLSWTFGANAFRGEDPNGTWTITLTELDATVDQDSYGYEADGVTLSLLGLDFYGQTASADDVYHYTDEVFDMLALEPARLILSDTGGVDWLDMAAMRGDLTVDLASDGTGGASDGALGSFIDIAAATVIENVVTGDGNETIFGNDAANQISGMRGDDILWGGAGPDLLIFKDGGGSDRIGDFTLEDTIMIWDTGLSAFGELTLTQEADGDTLISLGDADGDGIGAGDQITLAGFDASTLTADNFLFV